MRKTAAQIVAETLLRNAKRDERYWARREFNRIIGLFLDRHAGQRPQG